MFVLVLQLIIFSYLSTLVYNTKCEFVNIPSLVLCRLEAINIRELLAKKVIGIFIHLWLLIKTKTGHMSQAFTVYIVCEIEILASEVEMICNYYSEQSQETRKYYSLAVTVIKNGALIDCTVLSSTCQHPSSQPPITKVNTG